MRLDKISHPMILNYFSRIRIMQPSLSVDRPLSLLLGAGDIVHSGVSNVEQYGMYDMMICLPENAESLQQNIDKLTDTGPVLCILDVTDKASLTLFVEEFGGRAPHSKITRLAVDVSVGVANAQLPLCRIFVDRNKHKGGGRLFVLILFEHALDGVIVQCGKRNNGIFHMFLIGRA